MRSELDANPFPLAENLPKQRLRVLCYCTALHGTARYSECCWSTYRQNFHHAKGYV